MKQPCNNLLSELKLGMTEKEVSLRLSQLQRDHGGAGDSFPPTVLFGARSALPHGESGDTALQNGDTLLIDYGTYYNGYVSDITRTFFVGEPSANKCVQFMKLFWRPTLTGREAAKAGISGAELDRITTQVLRDYGQSEFIKHRTGHGIGLGHSRTPQYQC